jgi:hypothetical protein
MRAKPLILLSLLLLAACAGQIRDYVGPLASPIRPQLIRYGLNLAQTGCVADRLGATLTPRQMRLFARAAGAVRQGYFDPSRMTMRDLIWVAASMGDGGVLRLLRQADEACGVTASLDIARELAQAEARPARELPAREAPAATPRPSSWLSLGAAPSGQSIAIDAVTLEQEGNRRVAWFRMTNPGETAPDGNAYLLHIDCGGRTINAKARERRGEDGAVLEHVDYPDNPLPAEGGTVMEIAILSLCS